MHGEVTGEFILEKDEYRKRLWSQLVETYSKVMYTYETQQQAANIKNKLAQWDFDSTDSFDSGFLCWPHWCCYRANLCGCISLIYFGSTLTRAELIFKRSSSL